MTNTEINVGDRVTAGEGADRDTGRVTKIGLTGDGVPMARVHWDSGVETSADLSDLSLTSERHSGGHRVDVT